MLGWHRPCSFIACQFVLKLRLLADSCGETACSAALCLTEVDGWTTYTKRRRQTTTFFSNTELCEFGNTTNASQQTSDVGGPLFRKASSSRCEAALAQVSTCRDLLKTKKDAKKGGAKAFVKCSISMISHGGT